MNTHQIKKQLSAVALLLLTLTGCATNPVTGKQDLVLMSESQEVALGQSYHQQVLKEYSKLNNPKLQDYVNSLGQELAQQSHRDKLTFHFTVLDSPEINAFATPGGYVYITRGIMAYLNSEAELAGVIGHEIGHITARHGVRQQSTQAVTGILSSVLAAAADIDPNNQLVQGVNTAIVRGYGRNHELEADKLGAEYLARTGRKPERMIDVVRVLKNQELYQQQKNPGAKQASGYHGLFSTHPDNDTRLKEVVLAARKFTSSSVTPDNRDRFLRLMEGVTFGSSAAEGVIRGNTFYHTGLNAKLTAPNKWEIHNLPDQLIFKSKKTEAMTMVRVTSPGKAKTAEAFLKNHLGRSSLRDSRHFKANGLTGYTTTTIASNTPYGKTKVRYSAVIKAGQAWLFAGIAKDFADFELLERDFDNISKSLSPLTSADKNKAQPYKIKLVRAKTGDTYEKLARGNKSITDTNMLRLLNGDYPSGQPKAGQLIKVIH